MADKIILKFKTKNILNFYEIEPWYWQWLLPKCLDTKVFVLCKPAVFHGNLLLLCWVAQQLLTAFLANASIVFTFNSFVYHYFQNFIDADLVVYINCTFKNSHYRSIRALLVNVGGGNVFRHCFYYWNHFAKQLYNFCCLALWLKIHRNT